MRLFLLVTCNKTGESRCIYSEAFGWTEVDSPRRVCKLCLLWAKPWGCITARYDAFTLSS